MKFAASLAVASRLTTSNSAAALETKPADAPPAAKVADEQLARARKNPSAFMLSDPEIFHLVGDGHSRDLIFTSARDEQGNRADVRVPSSSIRILRADASADDF